MCKKGVAWPCLANDEVMKFQLEHYVSCNEAIWRLFSFPIQERHPTVVHLAVHMKNGQRVYFTEANAVQRTERPPVTTLTNYFSTCVREDFTIFGNATLLYMECCIEEVSTQEERWCCGWLRCCLFDCCPRMNIHSSSTTRRMLLSSLTFGEH